MNIKIACAVTKKKCPGREVKDLLFFYQRDTEVHFREFYCVIFYMFEISRRGRGAYPPPSQIYAWIGKLLKKPVKVIIINVLLILNKIKHTVLT